MKRFSLVLLGLWMLPALAGVSYKAETTVTTKGQKAIKTFVSASVEGDKARIDTLESNNPAVGKDSWILTKDGGKTMFMVNPKDKTYMSWNMGQLGAILGGMGNMFQMQFANASVEKLDEGPGDQLLGLDTTRYKFKTEYDLDLKVLGMKQFQHVIIEQESWNTEAFGDKALKAWLRVVPALGIEGLEKLMEDSMKAIKGFPLKSVSHSVTKQLDKSRTKVKSETNSVTEMSVTEIQEKTIDASVFEIPSDYQLVDPLAGTKDQKGVPSLKDLFGK